MDPPGKPIIPPNQHNITNPHTVPLLLPLSPQIVNEKCILDRPSNFSNSSTTSNQLIQPNLRQSKNLANVEPVFEANIKDITNSSYRNPFALQSAVPITNLTPGSLESKSSSRIDAGFPTPSVQIQQHYFDQYGDISNTSLYTDNLIFDKNARQFYIYAQENKEESLKEEHKVPNYKPQNNVEKTQIYSDEIIQSIQGSTFSKYKIVYSSEISKFHVIKLTHSFSIIFIEFYLAKIPRLEL